MAQRKKHSRDPSTLMPSQLKSFRCSLLAWYDKYRRDLPWRANRDPYRVWISEVMLQQTRVAAVIDHYLAFLKRFPTIEKLACAREASVLAAWSGLGYYRRARMMHAAAKVLVREHAGDFPRTEERLRELPGIGRYTAAAIASIAYDQPVAVVDGNVERVLNRLIGRSLCADELWQAAGDLLDTSRPGDFNQAMMELGATVCTPKTPACLTCPVHQCCATRGELAPIRKRTPQTKCVVDYALDCREGTVFLVQRARDASLMADLWELPQMTSFRGIENPAFSVTHSITTTHYTVRVWRTAFPSDSSGKWFHSSQIRRLPLTGLARKILRRAELNRQQTS